MGSLTLRLGKVPWSQESSKGESWESERKAAVLAEEAVSKVRTSVDGTDPFEDSRAAIAVASPPTTASRDPSSPGAECWKCIPTGTDSSVTPRTTTSAR